jgi:hypothetical protein
VLACGQYLGSILIANLVFANEANENFVDEDSDEGYKQGLPYRELGADLWRGRRPHL